MPVVVTPILVVVILAAGTLAGALGAMLGIGGGIFLVPFLTLVMKLPIGVAAAISLTTVIGTSSSVSAWRTGSHLINFRLGMALEVATAAGSLLGGITAQYLSAHRVEQIFAIVTALVGFTMLLRINRRNILSGELDSGVLGGHYLDQENGATVTYQVRRMPLALFASFVAGNVSSLLGIGGGVIKVPVLNAWCGVPVRAAAATSAFMIGVTAAGGAVIYYGNNQLIPSLAAAAILGVQAGTAGGMRLSARSSARALKLLMAAILFTVSVLMFYRSLQ